MTRRFQFRVRLLYLENHATFAATAVATFLGDHDVCVVTSVAQATRSIGSSAFDAALVDNDLDAEKGDVFVRHARQELPKLPIVAVSARPVGNQLLLAAGANAVCPKLRFAEIGRVLGELTSNS